MLELVEWLGESVSRHLSTRHIIKEDIAIIVFVLSILIVVVNVLCPLKVTVLADYVIRRKVISV